MLSGNNPHYGLYALRNHPIFQLPIFLKPLPNPPILTFSHLRILPIPILAYARMMIDRYAPFSFD